MGPIWHLNGDSQIRSQAVGTLFRTRSAPQHSKAQMLFSSPSHGENRGSSPLGSASKIRCLHFSRSPAHRASPTFLQQPFSGAVTLCSGFSLNYLAEVDCPRVVRLCLH